MEFTLIKSYNMNLKTTLLLAIFSSSCHCPKVVRIENKLDNLNMSGKVIHEGKWITNFKNEVFLRCLIKIYPPNFKAFIDTTDASSSANIDRLGYNKQLLKIADSLAEKFSQRPEALWTIENSKATINVCLGYRHSLELDSLSIFYFNKYYQE